MFAADKSFKVRIIEELGATAIYREQTTPKEYVDDHTGGRGFDVVYDTVEGVAPIRPSMPFGGSAVL